MHLKIRHLITLLALVVSVNILITGSPAAAQQTLGSRKPRLVANDGNGCFWQNAAGCIGRCACNASQRLLRSGWGTGNEDVY